VGRRRRLTAAGLIAVAAAALGFPASGQRLLLGVWQGALEQSTATLTIISEDDDGWLHGVLRYEPPQQDGFAGSPFSAHIEHGAFSIRLFNGTSYVGLHWCRDVLCGVFHAPDNTATPVTFARPPG